MKKKQPAPRSPQEAMQRFDRLLAAMAPAAETKAAGAKSRKPRGRKPRKRLTS